MEAKRRTLGLLVVLAALLGAALWAVTQSNAASQAASSAAAEDSLYPVDSSVVQAILQKAEDLTT